MSGRSRPLDSKNRADLHKWTVDEIPSFDAAYRQCQEWVETPGWTTIRTEIVGAFGSFKNVRSIEIGAGMGKTSMIFSLLGAHATVLDYNERVIRDAQRVHRAFGASTQFVHSDALHLPSRLLGAFDISMSFGTCEHFDGAERDGIFASHAVVLRPGGKAFIWVPNKMGVLFQLTHGLYKLVRGWDIFERNFLSPEVATRMKRAGLREVRVCAGTDLARDYEMFVRREIGAALRRRLGLANVQRSEGVPRGGAVGKEITGRAMKTSRASGPFDRWFAEALLGVGVK